MGSAKKTLLRSLSNGGQAASKGMDVFAVYAGDSQKKQFVVPIYLLNEPSFQEILHEAEEEFGYKHPLGGQDLSQKHISDQVGLEAVKTAFFQQSKAHLEHSSVPLKCFASCADENSLVT
ncbi:hypothetical protein TIFTF001_032423 [Ficus carica]|uniref:Uncharacterized protein n=1 Tax=Ficus carica TaxID=3494 RepID=A0AA88J5R9_FICCA|nr:hypothetical protein TIFTF001_032423 [Ficus carica]